MENTNCTIIENLSVSVALGQQILSWPKNNELEVNWDDHQKFYIFNISANTETDFTQYNPYVKNVFPIQLNKNKNYKTLTIHVNPAAEIFTPGGFGTAYNLLFTVCLSFQNKYFRFYEQDLFHKGLNFSSKNAQSLRTSQWKGETELSISGV